MTSQEQKRHKSDHAGTEQTISFDESEQLVQTVEEGFKKERISSIDDTHQTDSGHEGPDRDRAESKRLSIKEPKEVLTGALKILHSKHQGKDSSSTMHVKSILSKKQEQIESDSQEVKADSSYSWRDSSKQLEEVLSLSAPSATGIDLSAAELQRDMYTEEKVEQEIEDGFDENIYFDKKSCGSSEISLVNSQESEDISDSTYTGLDTTVIPFSLLWTFGMNTKVPFMNLTEHSKHHVFFTASHEGVIYDYKLKKMQLLQGHQNAITSASMDAQGIFLVTADAGPENSIIVWQMHKCKPVCTIFDANPGSGTTILTMSPNGKYIVSVTSDMPAIIKFWDWSDGSDTSVDRYVTDPTYGKPIGVVFNRMVQERFMESKNRRLTDPRVPEIRNRSRIGKITDSCYVENCHECFASSTEGHVLVLGNTFYKKEYDINNEYNAKKIFIKSVKVSSCRLNTINSTDGVLVTGDVRGQIKFYDTNVTILYWCQKFRLPGVQRISFDRQPRKYVLGDSANIDELSLNASSQTVLNKEYNDVADEYETLYKNMVPSDATLQRLPFIVRNFIVATDDGNLVKIDYINNLCDELLVTAEAPVASVDVHEDKPYLVIAYRNGRISLYDYDTHLMIHTSLLPALLADPQTQNQSQSEFQLIEERTSDAHIYKSLTYIKFSPRCYHLAVGRGNGEIFFLEPVLLRPKDGYPMRHGINPVMKITFSTDLKYFAYYDKNRTVFLFYYNCENDDWLMIGKIRSHTKELTDLIFSPYNPPELYSIGLDKHLVKYDMENSVNELIVESRRRIDQTAVPNCFIFYPLLEEKCFLIADNQYKLKLLERNSELYRHVFLGPAYGCYSEAPIKQMSLLPCPSNKYLIFNTRRHIGIQKLPADGNPYKYTGTVGHPIKVHEYSVSPCGKYIFTSGKQDACVLMWQINPESVDNLEQVGGKEIHPFYCLIEGGSRGWLFTEMQNLFYYMQILHQGENSQLPRVVSDSIALSELPDLMRACGFYPTDYEVETMINDVRCRNRDNKTTEDEISFREFIVLYINHRPAHGISMERLQKAFNTVCEIAGNNRSVEAQDFIDTLCDNGEKFTEEGIAKCMSVLTHYNQEIGEDEQEEDVMAVVSALPQVITFDNFVGDILGIDMSRNEMT